MDQENPYQVQATTHRRMDREQKILEFYWQHREVPPTLGTIISQFARSWLIRLITMVLAVYFLRDAPLVFLVVGMLLGAILRDISSCRQLVRLWPLYQEIIHWKHVEDKLAGADSEQTC
jgi:hypothetical protein